MGQNSCSIHGVRTLLVDSRHWSYLILLLKNPQLGKNNGEMIGYMNLRIVSNSYNKSIEN